MFKVAENAVKCFEKWSNTKVALHGYTPAWSNLLPVKYSIHRHHACREIKHRSGEDNCVECDMIQLRNVISDYPFGGIKICPHNIAEWFLPLRDERGIQAILFSGIRRIPENYSFELPIFKSKFVSAAQVPAGVNILAPGEETFVMEGLNQLAARIIQLFIQSESNRLDLPRSSRIIQIIRKHYRNPDLSALLCAELSLSESRMRHVIPLETGSSLQELVINIRLYRIQMDLLHTDKPVAEIAEYHGFSNMSHFYRTFKLHFGVSPRIFRKNSGIID